MSVENYIYKQVAEHKISVGEAKKYLMELEHNDKCGDIAVIGMAGKFPLADNLDEFWDNLRSGKVCIGDFPMERRSYAEQYMRKFDMEELIHDNCIDENGNIHVNYQRRGFMKRVDYFDADFFDIPPREAKAMDVNQKLFLESAYQAIEDAGYCGQSIYGKNVGVFVGIDHVEDHKYKKIAAKDPMVVTGTWPGILASRLSYIYNFHGPAMVIDTACSSGLVSVHEACKAIKNRECEMAIAGGVSSFYYLPYLFSTDQSDLENIESPDDTVRTFDNNANGTTWGEGLGVIVLKSLDKALEDRDVIHAVIKGSAINNDGASNGITAPSAEAQELLLKQAWTDAGIEPETIGYIEAHGTGTVLGDPIEIRAMTNAFRAYTDRKQFCAVGSSKPCIGHLIGASGMASIIKVIKMLENGEMIGSKNFEYPNRFINFTESPVYINDSFREWYKGEVPRRAGVNSFGFSGTNCHVVLEEKTQSETKSNIEKPFYIYTISAKKPELLKALIKDTLKYVSTSDVDICSASYTSNVCRGHYQERIALLVQSAEDLENKLKYLDSIHLNSINKFGIFYGSHKIISENKKNRIVGDITEGERRTITLAAKEKLQVLISDYDMENAYELCNDYVSGADVTWSNLYDGMHIVKSRIPTYPLSRTSYLYDIVLDDNNDNKLVAKPKTMISALIDEICVKSIFGDIYKTVFTCDKHWLLQDHVILGNHIIPGTTYIEMALELMRRYVGESVKINDVMYYSPCIVGVDEEKEVQSVVSEKNGVYTLKFMSMDETGTWTNYAECTAQKCNKKDEKLNLDAIREEVLNQTGKSYIHRTNDDGPIQLGTRWHNEKSDTEGKRSILCRIRIPEGCEKDLDNSYLHVAMFDNAMNAISQSVVDDLYLPYFYNDIEFYAPMPTQFYTYIRISDKTIGTDFSTITYDVDMICDDGTVFGRVRDYTTKRVSKDIQKSMKNARSNVKYYSSDWTKDSAFESDADVHFNKHMLVINSGRKQSAIEEALKEKNANVDVITTEGKLYSIDEYVNIFEKLSDPKPEHIIFVVDSLKAGKDMDNLKSNIESSVYSFYNLIKALLAKRFSDDVNITIIGKGLPVVAGDIVIPEMASLASFSKVVSVEYPNFDCRYVDIDDRTNVDTIINDILANNIKENHAFRNNTRFSETLKEIALVKKNDVTVRDGGVYLITGGTGGLGLEMAQYVGERASNVNIILVNRSSFPGKAQWDSIITEGVEAKKIHAIEIIRTLENAGHSIQIVQGDVSIEDDVKRIIDAIATQFGTVDGIFHCAGVAGDGIILQKELSTFESVISPKVFGSMLLDKYTAKYEPDFMLLFSSMLSVFGDIGQSDYMSGNSYMDSFAVYRNNLGRFTRTINWPAWKETGMAIDYNVADAVNTIDSIYSADALNAIDEIMASEYVRVLPGKLNVDVLAERQNRYRFRFEDKLSRLLERKKQEMKNRKPKTESIKLEIKSHYTKTESILYTIWAEVIGTGDFDITDTFSSLGGDSFLAIQLFKAINKEFDGVIEMADIFTYPSVQEMAEYIDNKYGMSEKKENTADGEKQPTTIEDAVSMIEGLI